MSNAAEVVDAAVVKQHTTKRLGCPVPLDTRNTVMEAPETLVELGKWHQPFVSKLPITHVFSSEHQVVMHAVSSKHLNSCAIQHRCKRGKRKSHATLY